MKYSLYDLRISTTGDEDIYNCTHVAGDGFEVRGENITFMNGTTHFSHYALATLLPFIAAKQRVCDEKDWMFYEDSIACPDPQCGARFKIERIGQSVYEYGDA